MALASFGYAQVAGTQYFMNSLPQYVGNNPAFIPKYKFSLGLPGSMVDANYYNNGFTYNDFIENKDGRHVASLPRLSAAVPGKTYITANGQVDLFRLGIKIGNGSYLSLNSSVRGYSYSMIPKDAVALLADPNSIYEGRTVNISPRTDITSFWENSIGLAITPFNKVTLGARIKVLQGLTNANTIGAHASISTNTDDHVTLAASMNARSSGMNTIKDKFRLSDYAGNNGFAFDLGVTFKPIEKLTVAASLVDIGAIKWRADLTQYTLDPSRATYTYTKADVDKILNDDDGAGAIVDTLKAKFKPVEARGSAYSTMLPAKLLLSANYDFGKNFSVGTMMFAERMMGRVSTGFTVGANKHFGKIVSTTFSYTVSNRSYNNFGAGLSLNLTPLQFYIVGDNLLRLPVSAISHGNADEFVRSTQVFTLRAGVNIVWGWTSEAPKKVGKKVNKKETSRPANFREKRR